jgi:hypothetical protein
VPDVRIASSPSIVCVRCCTDSLFLRLCSAYYYADAYPQHNGVPGAMNPDFNLTCCTKAKLLAAKAALERERVPVAYLQARGPRDSTHRPAALPPRPTLTLTGSTQHPRRVH